MATIRIEPKLSAVGSTRFAVMSRRTRQHGDSHPARGLPDTEEAERLRSLQNAG